MPRIRARDHEAYVARRPRDAHATLVADPTPLAARHDVAFGLVPAGLEGDDRNARGLHVELLEEDALGRRAGAVRSRHGPSAGRSLSRPIVPAGSVQAWTNAPGDRVTGGRSVSPILTASVGAGASDDGARYRPPMTSVQTPAWPRTSAVAPVVDGPFCPAAAIPASSGVRPQPSISTHCGAVTSYQSNACGRMPPRSGATGIGHATCSRTRSAARIDGGAIAPAWIDEPPDRRLAGPPGGDGPLPLLRTRRRQHVEGRVRRERGARAPRLRPDPPMHQHLRPHRGLPGLALHATQHFADGCTGADVLPVRVQRHARARCRRPPARPAPRRAASIGPAPPPPVSRRAGPAEARTASSPSPGTAGGTPGTGRNRARATWPASTRRRRASDACGRQHEHRRGQRPPTPAPTRTCRPVPARDGAARAGAPASARLRSPRLPAMSRQRGRRRCRRPSPPSGRPRRARPRYAAATTPSAVRRSSRAPHPEQQPRQQGHDEPRHLRPQAGGDAARQRRDRRHRARMRPGRAARNNSH